MTNASTQSNFINGTSIGSQSNVIIDASIGSQSNVINGTNISKGIKLKSLSNLENMKDLEFTTADLSINSYSGRAPYHKTDAKMRKRASWGQRKLLLSEIEFLTLFWNPNLVPNPVVLYVGASPGTHISLLVKLFPQVREWHCYDPRPFKIKQSDKVKLYEKYFTDEDAIKWSDRKDIFFISDIRSADYTKMSDEENELAVWNDQDLQRRWVYVIKPVEALLKFRLPYYDRWIDMMKPDSKWKDKYNMPYPNNPKIVTYLKGLMFFQPWSPQTSSETRLVPLRNSEGEYYDGDYDILDYDQIMFYHNNVDRELKQYKNPWTKDLTPIYSPELLNDYDSSAETYILSKYLFKLTAQEASHEQVIQLSEVITQHLNTTRKTKKYKTLDILRNSEMKSIKFIKD